MGDLYEPGMFHRGTQWNTGGAAWSPQSHPGLTRASSPQGFIGRKGRAGLGREGTEIEFLDGNNVLHSHWNMAAPAPPVDGTSGSTQGLMPAQLLLSWCCSPTPTPAPALGSSGKRGKYSSKLPPVLFKSPPGSPNTTAGGLDISPRVVVRIFLWSEGSLSFSIPL